MFMEMSVNTPAYPVTEDLFVKVHLLNVAKNIFILHLFILHLIIYI